MSICDQMDAHSHTSLSRVKTFLLKATRACTRENNVIFVLFLTRNHALVTFYRTLHETSIGSTTMLFNEIIGDV